MKEQVSIVNRVAIGDIIRRAARRNPDKTALIFENRSLTYKQFDEACNQFAHYLIELGFEKGDAIATICGNSIDHTIAMFGIQKAGLIWVPINSRISIDEKEYILNKVKAKMIIGDREFLAPDLEKYRDYLLIVTGEESQEIGKPFATALDGQSVEEPDVEIHDRDIAQIMFTSGTTGYPKGVMTSHLAVYFASFSNIIEMNIQKEDVATTLMPMFHCAQHTFLTSFLTMGATNVVFRSFEPESFLKTIEDQKITFTFALPMMYRAIMNHPKRSNYDLSSLRMCIYAMAPMDRHTLEKGIKELNADFALGTGQTEMYPATMLFKPEEQLRRFGSYWGTTTIMNDTAIMDDNGNLLPKGQVGEIVHRGPNVMSGYLDNEEATKETRLYGWHHTGDIGYWDEDGQMVFVDRKKDLIKTGGENVSSIKVEQTLLKYEKVADATVVGLPHDHWNEAVTAFVVPKPDTTLSEEEIIDYCKQNLGWFQVPKKVVFLEQFPMTTTGKIQKHKIRDQYKDLYTTSHYSK